MKSAQIRQLAISRSMVGNDSQRFILQVARLLQQPSISNYATADRRRSHERLVSQ